MDDYFGRRSFRFQACQASENIRCGVRSAVSFQLSMTSTRASQAAIVTGAGLDTEHLVLRLDPSAMLSGKILDELGEPVRQDTVSLYREDRQVGVGLASSNFASL